MTVASRFQHVIAVAQRHRTKLCVLGVVLLAVLGLAALRSLLDTLRPGAIRAAIADLQGWRIAAAMAFTILSYLVLTLYDLLALRIIGRPLPYRTAALASFTSYALSNNLGLSVLTGGSARYLVYSAAGLRAGDIARVVVIAGMTFWSGIVVLAGASLMLQPSEVMGASWLPPLWVQQSVGGAVLVAAALTLLASRTSHRLALGNWTLPMPTTRQILAQIGLAAADLSAASAALFVLIPSVGPELFPALILAYIAAIIATLVSHVPGGLGVFETVMIAMLPELQRPDLIAALLAYRAIYYLLPLIVATALLLAVSHRRWLRPAAGLYGGARSVFGQIAPVLMSTLCFMGGAILLIFSALPSIGARLRLLRDIVPLPFVEASHIAASLVGTGLILIAPNLLKRLDGAFVVARALLLGGAAFALLKGLDIEQAIVLSLIAGLLQWSRPAFYRRTAMTSSVSAQWTAASLVVLACALWVGFFSYRHIPYQDDLWWEFAWRGDAPRFLRASFAGTILLLAVLLTRLFRPAPPRRSTGGLDAQDTAILGTAQRTDAMLLLTGDKHILRSDSGAALLMYQVQGSSWIVMGDPVGPVAEWSGLLWKMREMADAEQGRLLLYQLSPAALPIAIDLGLQLVKYGEEARVDLSGFSLEGSTAKPLRAAVRRIERQGATFEIVPAAQVASIMRDLEAISARWLAGKTGREKSFSVGRFDPAYIARFDCAIVRQGGNILAFANIWATENREELSIDLMRHVDAMPNGTMDFLFVELMKWGKAHGYRWFTLGLAPLSGIEARRLAPLWANAAGYLYRYGNGFYRFEGLRAYKQKFSPTWEPRYIASVHGLGLAHALMDLQTLIGGGRSSAAVRHR